MADDRRSATGAPGFPNLRDDSWLWGGSIQDIHQTIAQNQPQVRQIHAGKIVPGQLMQAGDALN